MDRSSLARTLVDRNSVPLVVELDPDVDAAEVFRAVARRPHPFFLDSAAGPARGDSRTVTAFPGGAADFSIVGCDPFLIVTAHGDALVVRDEDGTASATTGDPLARLDELLWQHRIPAAGDLPFSGGAVGYLGYDLCHFVEQLPRTTGRDVAMPDTFFAFYDVAAVFDHRSGRGFVVSSGMPQRGGAGRARAESRAEWFAGVVSGRETEDGTAVQPRQSPMGAAASGLRSNFTRDQYLRAVERAREYIFAGDIYQVNLSQRFEAPLAADPILLYEALRSTSPAPFGAYLDTGAIQILSNSPERFLRRRRDRVETRPIKGTRPRQTERRADREAAARLQASEKDAAEHLMIVDLERNDLGRVCEYGSVVVDELARLESYWNVHHLVSTVSGRLRPGVRTAELLRATFPGGSITGAPKVRAMEIIDELEPTSRGVYTGAIGYLSACGRIDLNIAIRTLVYDGAKAYFQVGGGIVADSDAASEYDETLDKATAFFALLGARRPREVHT